MTDTIDLQDHHGPSAQDQSHPRLDPDGNHFAPHQAETLRDVAHETAQDLLRSPTLPAIADPDQAHKTSANSSHPADDLAVVKDKNPDAQATDLTDAMDAYRQHEQDAIAAAHNGPSSSDEEDLDDAIDDLDDDLMDKISSSPSIEDGVYSLTTAPAADAWPRRVSSLPTSARFRRQAAARYFSAHSRPSSVNQQPRHLLLSRSTTSLCGEYLRTKSEPETDAEIGPAKAEPDTPPLTQREALCLDNQIRQPVKQQDNRVD